LGRSNEKSVFNPIDKPAAQSPAIVRRWCAVSAHLVGGVSGEVLWQPDEQNTGTKRMLPSSERTASGGATLLGYAAEIGRSSAQKLPKERLQTTAGCSANH
jgi:hypothetical protein